MKLALLADLHANLEAVTACLAHARGQGADAYAFLGDLVGYGADPGPVLDLVARHAADGAVVVRGNHDTAAALGGGDTMDRGAEAAIDWTRSRLAPVERAFLGGLPLVVRREDMCFVHASAAHPEEWAYVDDAARAGESLTAAGATYVFCGHVHVPALYYTSPRGRPLAFQPVAGVPVPVPARRRWLAVVGSSGQPRDANTAACYALADRSRRTLTFFRVPYDWRTAAAKVRAAGLPERLARRLERGQ
jgi:diadenosine tetraphosphatase ApaH/serine/threonine PP2A family protein phosphatase